MRKRRRRPSSACKAQRGEAGAKSRAKCGVFKATKKPKDKKAPKRATAYNLSTMAERAAVKAVHPELKATPQINKELSMRWKALSAVEKATYETQMASAKKAHAAQLATYKKSDDFAANEEVVAAWKRGEEARKAKAQAAGIVPKVSLPRKPKDANCPKPPYTCRHSLPTFCSRRHGAAS